MSSFSLERVDSKNTGKTGLLTRDAFLIACAFPPLLAVACNRLFMSLTVAGQWRIFTALPVHLAMSFL
jgi:hypothetical protein